jgi:hypothetical protein
VLGVSTFANVSFIVLFLVPLVGRGVAIDYSLPSTPVAHGTQL